MTTEQKILKTRGNWELARQMRFSPRTHRNSWLGGGFPFEPEDLDPQERTLRVERAWSPGGLKATKTYEDRSVDLSPDLARLLQRHVPWLKSETLRHACRSSESFPQ